MEIHRQCGGKQHVSFDHHSLVSPLRQDISQILTHFSSYINFAFGDEQLATVYGQNVPRLQKIKAQYDPAGRFSQFFPLSQGK